MMYVILATLVVCILYGRNYELLYYERSINIKNIIIDQMMHLSAGGSCA